MMSSQKVDDKDVSVVSDIKNYIYNEKNRGQNHNQIH